MRMSKDGKMIEQIRKNSISINKLNEFAETVKKCGVTAEKFSSFFDESKELADKICSEMSTKRKDECIIVSGKLSFCSHVDKKYNYKEKDLIARKVLEGGFYYCEGCRKTINGDVDTDTDDWIDLDINNIPSDFFVNENYEYGYQFTCDKTWSTQTNLTPLGFIEFMQNNTNTIFRYRLKPLESEKPKRIMKVTQRIYDMFYHELIIGMAYIGYKSHMDGEDMIIDNCKVELL